LSNFYYTHVDKAALAQRVMRYLTETADRMMHIQQAHNDNNVHIDHQQTFFNIKYDDLVADPQTCVQSLCAQLQLSWTAEIEETIAQHLQESTSKHQQARYRYSLSLAEWGIDDAMVRKHFETYLHTFNTTHQQQ
jgi:LPS sulfotransferase NodH